MRIVRMRGGGERAGVDDNYKQLNEKVENELTAIIINLNVSKKTRAEADKNRGDKE